MAIQNIYIRTRQRGAYPESNKQFLDAIQQRIIDYQAIATGHERPMATVITQKQEQTRKAQLTHTSVNDDPASLPRGSVNKAAEAGSGSVIKSSNPGTPSMHGTGASSGGMGASTHGGMSNTGASMCRAQKASKCKSINGSGAGFSLSTVDAQGKANGASLTRAGMS